MPEQLAIEWTEGGDEDSLVVPVEPPSKPTSPLTACDSLDWIDVASGGLLADELLSSEHARFTTKLASLLSCEVSLTFTQNRTRMMSATRRDGRVEMRLHECFREAPSSVWQALCDFVATRDARHRSILDAFVREAPRAASTSSGGRGIVLRPRGVHHHLQTIFDTLKSQFSEDFTGVHITWGKQTRRRGTQYSLCLGTYSFQHRVIRIHPVLDQAWVPEFAVASVVHHEMVHHVVPVTKSGDRSYFHSPEFRFRERTFTQFRDAEQWHEQNLTKLLASIPRAPRKSRRR